MKRALLLLTFFTASTLALPTSAQSTEGVFVNGQLGRSNLDQVSFSDHDTAWSINAGYRWSLSAKVLFGLEAGYLDLGEFESRTWIVTGGSNDNYPHIGRDKLHGWAAGLNVHIDITPEWYFSARGGYFHGERRTNFPTYQGDIVAFTNLTKETSNKWYVGAGFGYNLNPNISVGLHYDRYKIGHQPSLKNGYHWYKLNPKVLSLRVEHRF